MNRLNRTLATAIVIAVLLAFAAPAAQALPTAKPQTVRFVATDWLNTALSWLSPALSVGRRAPEARSSQKKAPASTGGPGDMTPMTGSCIDPLGCVDGGR